MYVFHHLSIGFVINTYGKADKYKECNEMTYAEMIAMLDYEEPSELGNDEENSIVSTDEIATLTPHPSKPQQPSPASTVHNNININYSYFYSIARKFGDKLIFLPSCRVFPNTQHF